MRKYLMLLIAVFGVALYSCNDGQKQKKIDELQQLGDQAKEFENGKPNYGLVNDYLSAIDEYNSDFPEDTLNLKYLYDAAQYALTIEKPDLCLNYLDKILQQYGYEQATSKALFLKAFVEENYIGNLEAAKSSYQLFIDHFPQEEKMVEDAKVAIDNLGVPADEMLKRIMEKNAAAQDSTGS